MANEQTSIRKGFSTVIRSAILSRGEGAFPVFAVRLREAVLSDHIISQRINE